MTEDVSLELIDAIIQAFRELRRSASPLDAARTLKELDPDKRRQAFQELVNRRLAIPVERKYYQISPEGQQTFEHELLYRLLKPRYDGIKTTAETRSHMTNGSNGLMVLSLFLLATAMTALAVIGASSPFFLVLTLVFVIVLFASMVLDLLARKKAVSREEETAVDLLGAYEIYSPFIAGKVRAPPGRAIRLVKKAANRLEKATETGALQSPPPPPWFVLKSLREEISKIGKDLRTGILPIMKLKARSESVGSVLVSLAKFLFEASPSGIQQASGLLSPYRPHGEPTGLVVWFDRIRNAVQTRLLMRFVFCLLAVFGVGVITLYATNWNWTIAGVVGTWFGIAIALAVLWR